MNPLRVINASIGLLESMAAHWEMYEQVEAALLPAPLRGTSYDGAGGHGSTIPDPTGELATQLTASGHGGHSLADTTDALEAILVQARWAQSRVNTRLRQHPDLARDADATVRALRCDGSVDPTCTRNAVRSGICWACYQRKRRGATAPNMATRPKVAATVSCPCGWSTDGSGDDDIEVRRALSEAFAEHKTETSCPLLDSGSMIWP